MHCITNNTLHYTTLRCNPENSVINPGYGRAGKCDLILSIHVVAGLGFWLPTGGRALKKGAPITGKR
jgi:hypothetical protein